MLKKIKSFLINGETDFKIIFPDLTNSQLERELKKYFNQIDGSFKISSKKVENDYFKVKNGVISFKIKNIDLLFSELKEEKFVPKSIRDFALIHETHNNKTNIDNGSWFLTREVVMKDTYSYEAVFFKDDFYSKKENIKHLIILENQKIFQIINLKEYFSSFLVDGIEDKDLVIFGSGNKINTAKKNIDFFKQFDKILYFGDYDDEGYFIYKRLESLLENIEFILPKKEVVESIQKEMINVSNIQEILSKKSPIKKLLNCKFSMQQEAFLL